MNLALIGYRGTGKSSVAQRLAVALGWDWVDADVEIELAAGKSIASIFADEGEASFRDRETAILEQLVARDRCVLALGGGAVLRPENRAALRRCTHVVWLTASPRTLWQRISQDDATAGRRPNLTASGGLNEIIATLEERAQIYRQCADLEVDTEGKPADLVAREILERLGPL